MLAVALFIGATILFLYFILSPYQYWKNKNVPSPPVSYLFGNIGSALLLRKSIQEVYDELYKRFSDYPYIGFYKIRTPCLLLRDLDIIKDVLVRNFDSFMDNDIYPNEKHDPLFAKNPFVSRGHVWKENRNQMTPSFTAKRVKDMFPLIEAAAKNLVKHIDTDIVRNVTGVEAKSLFTKFTTDVVTGCALGLDANSFTDQNSEYIKMINTIFSPTFIGKIRLFLIFNFPLLNKLLKLKLIPDAAEQHYRNVVKKAIEYRVKNNVQRGDFLDTMNKLKEESESSKFTDDDIAGNVLSFITEGTETSAIVLSFTLYELAINLDIQAKLRDEIDKAIEKHQSQLTLDVINEIEYLEQVINESMRKNPPAPLIRRVCTSSFNIESPYRNGTNTSIEPGTPVIIPIHSLHHDPKYYQNPSAYDPSRFSNENKEKLVNYTYLPFGEGPRICLGTRFGYAQIKAALVHVIANFEIRINQKTVVPYKIDPQYFLLEARGGLWIDIYRRS